MKKYITLKKIIAVILIIVVFIVVIIVSKTILKNIDDSINETNNEMISKTIDFDLMNIDLENFDFNKYSIKDCEKIVKDVIDKYNNNEYDQHNSSSINSKINRLKELVEVKKYYEEVSACIDHIKKNATFEEQKELYYKTDEDIVLELCDENNDWSLLKISNNLYDTMKKNKGLLGSDDIKRFYIDNKPPYKVQRIKLIYENEKQKVELIISKEMDYVYADENSYGSEIISNFVIEDTINLTDTKGNEVDTRRVFTKENTRKNFEELCKDGDERGEMDYPDGEHYGYYGDNVAVSNYFRSKYPYFLDIFVHYSPLEYNKIILKDLDIENQIATFEVDSVLECKKRTYEVKYMLNEDEYLDDVKVKILKEEAIQPNRQLQLNYNRSQDFYLNTNFDEYKQAINGTDNYYNELKKYGSWFIDIELLDNNFKFEKPYYESIGLNNNNGFIGRFKMKDNTYCFYYRKIIYTDKMQKDGVINGKLPYDSSLTLEKVRDKFIADKKLQIELGIEVSE